MNKKLTKALTLALCTALLFSLLVSCAPRQDKSEKIKVLGTVFPQFDFAREIGKDRIECEMLMSPGTDSHSYTGDSPADVMKIQKSDLFIYVGGESDEGWVTKTLDTIRRSGEKVPVTLSLIDVCDVLEESDDGIIETEEEHEEGDGGEAEYDEHVWTSLSNSAKAVEAICSALCSLDADNAEYYRKNAEDYIEKLEALDKEFEEVFDGRDDKTLVFADRFPFRYFAEDYSLTCFAAFNGCASQSEPSPTTIVRLCNLIEEKQLRNVFYMETSQSGVPAAIEKATGAAPLLLHSCHTVTARQLDEGVSYLTLMKQNLETLKKAYQND